MKSKMSLIVIFAVIGSMCFYSQLGFAQAGGQNPGSGHMNPPGAKGGPGAGPKVTQHPNPPGAKGGPGAGPSFNRPGNQPDAQAGPGAKQHYVNPPGAAGGPGMGRNFKQHADQNQDGTVNGVERKLAREKWQENHQQGLQEKEHRFNPPGEAGGPGMGEGFKERMDRNNDGVVDDFERQAALKKWKEAHPGESGMSDELKQKMDQNGDGVVDPLEKQAALSKWKETHPGAGMSPEMKQKMDRNGDGVVDDTERQAAKMKWQEMHPGQGQQGEEGRGFNPPGQRGGPGMGKEFKERMDVNDDGKVGFQERKFAQEHRQDMKDAHREQGMKNHPGDNKGPGAGREMRPNANPKGPAGGPAGPRGGAPGGKPPQ